MRALATTLSAVALTLACSARAPVEPRPTTDDDPADAGSAADRDDEPRPPGRDGGEPPRDAAISSIADAGADPGRLRPGLNPVSPAALGLLDLLDHRAGHARGVRGGADGNVYLVTSLDDSGPFTLRDAAESDGPLWIVFGVDGTIRLESPIRITSNKTIDGRARLVDLHGSTLRVFDARDVIIENVLLAGGSPTSGDGIAIYRSDTVWVDHCTLRDFSDETLSVRATPSVDQFARVTVSFTRFDNQDKTFLLGIQHIHSDVEHRIRATLHHSYFAATEQRQPRTAQASLHAYNNVHEDFGIYAIAATQGARVLLEGNVYAAKRSTHVARTDLDTHDGSDRVWEGSIRLGAGTRANLLLDGAVLDASAPERVATPGYPYEVDVADECLIRAVTAEAGRHRTPSWTIDCADGTR